MNELQLIETFRGICGEQTDSGYSLTVGTLEVPNFVETDHQMVLPEIIILPFISDITMDKTTVICGTQATPTRHDFELKHARFQIDIYAQNIIDLLKIKSELEKRVTDFVEVELINFNDNTNWAPYDSDVYINDDYTSERDIVKLKEPSTVLTRVEAIEELTDPGTWYLDDNGLYVYPNDDIENIEIFELLNGLVLSDGTTAYGAGIQYIDPIVSRKLGDEDPAVERWSIDYMVSYRVLRNRNLGTKLEEIDMDVQKD